MFSFGSFSSLMPLLVLAITYFAGLTTYSLTFAHNKSSKKTHNEKTHEFNNQKQTELLNTDSFSFTYYNTDRIDQALLLKHPGFILKKHPFTIYKNSSGILPIYAHYLRPPPHAA